MQALDLAVLMADNSRMDAKLDWLCHLFEVVSIQILASNVNMVCICLHNYIYILYTYIIVYIYISLLYSKHKSIGCTAVNWGEISQRGPAEVHQTGRQRSPGGFDNGSFSLFTLNIGRHIWLPIWLRNSTYLYDYIYDYRILQIWLDMTTVDMTRYGYRRWLDISRYD